MSFPVSGHLPARFLSRWGRALLLAPACALILHAGRAPAQETPGAGQELVPIEFSMKRAGGTEINSIQREGRVFLPLRQMFDFLRIRNLYDPATGRITGFIASADTTYDIRPSEGTGRVGKRSESFEQTEYVQYGDDFFFLPEFYQRLFALPIEYKERRVAAAMPSRRDLPFFLDARMRRQEQKLAQRDVLLDPTIRFPRQYPLLDGLRVDWNFSQTLSPERLTRRTFIGGFSAFVLGGDLMSRYNLALSPDFDLRDSRHLWRYVPPSSRLFHQFLVGDFVTDGLLTREKYGVRLTSIPPYSRLRFAPQTIMGSAFAGRKTYLLGGGTLVGVADSTADGSYSFEAPLRYGANFMNVRSYSFWGELYEDAYRFLVPNTMVPPGEVDYDISIGRLREPSYPIHGSVSTLWGMTSRVTVGGRVEYFEYRFLERRVFPSLTGTARFSPHIVGEALFSPDNIGRASLLAAFPSSLGLEASYTRYKEIRFLNPRNAIYEFIFSGSYPFQWNGLRMGLSSRFVQTVLHPARERLWVTTVEPAIGFFYPRVAHFVGWLHSYQTQTTATTIRETDLSARFRLPREVFLGIGTTYDHLESEFVDLRVDAAVSPASRFVVDFNYTRNLRASSTLMRLEVRYIFPWARAFASATSSRGRILYTQRIGGSLGVVPSTGDFFYDYRPRTSFGGFFVRPFLDVNNNGSRDAGEEAVTSGTPRTAPSEEGYTAVLRRHDGLGWGNANLLPYREYALRFEQGTLDEPLWRPRYETFTVIAEPGRQRIVDLPIIVGGVVRGMVGYPYEEGDSVLQPLATVRVRLTETGGGERPYEATVETYSTGEFEFVGVPPGEYRIAVDAGQLARAGFIAREPAQRVTVQATREGDYVEGVDFVLTELE
ncbi:MAG: carboxypeptidase-like regulatory domain-containing protein [Bacteroidota bacterium]